MRHRRRVIASDPPTLAARAAAGFESAEARSAKAEAKQSRFTCAEPLAEIASSRFALLAMTVTSETHVPSARNFSSVNGSGLRAGSRGATPANGDASKCHWRRGGRPQARLRV